MNNQANLAPWDGQYRWYQKEPPDSTTQEQVIKYARMAKQFMNKPFGHPNDVVGNIGWHEAFPYEEHLLRNANLTKESRILDFACGPGRMVNRMKKLFTWVDGCDISEYCLEYASKTYPESNFYVTSGIDLGLTPLDTYDFIYATISVQHIPSRTIRQNLWAGFSKTLRENGQIKIQMAYHPTYQAGIWSHDTEHGKYDYDFWNASATNGHQDCVVNEQDLPLLKKDVNEYFDNVSFEFEKVSDKYHNLSGHVHGNYWADSWIYIYGVKK